MPLPRPAALAVLLTAAACAPSPGSAPPAPAPPPPVPAAPATKPVVDREPEPIRWRVAESVNPAPRDHHATFVVRDAEGGSWIYLAGGFDYRQRLADVSRARVGADGSLGPWDPAGTLPDPRAGHSVAQENGIVVLTGGKKEGNADREDVIVARVRTDGTLGPWETAAPMPEPRFHHASVVHGDRVYVLGGQFQGRSMPTVFSARVTMDGRIRTWETLDPMPRGRSHHAAFVHDGAVWVVAGLDGNPAGENVPLRDVQRAPILPDGRLGAWEPVAELDSAYATHSAFVHGGRLYVVGGVVNNARFTDAIHTAPLLPGGGLGEWERLEPGLPVARGHVHQMPVVDGRVYVVGGSANQQVTGEALVGTLP